MHCPRHPDKNTVSTCKDCGAEFCIDCIKETDQTTYCPDCYRRKLKEIALQYSSPAKKEGEREKVSAGGEKPSPRDEEVPALSGDGTPVEDEAPAVPPSKRSFFALRRRGRKSKDREGELAPGSPEEAFLSAGPDDDFSFLSEKKEGFEKKARRKKAAAPPDEEKAGTPPGREEAPSAGAGSDSEEDLLDDVVSTLLKSDTAEAAGEAAGRAAEKPGARREERAERWSFLAQPRSSEYTILASKWWQAALFIALMLLLGAVLWAVPNAFLIPKDQEYGIHAVVIGAIIGLAFWWKAGKVHGTKLAIQASLTTLFAIIIGEFLHWFLVIVKLDAFRTIFFDLISFRFIWESGPEIMRKTLEAMFPTSFLLILILPTAVTFIITYGMPPIPEIFFQIGRALRGKPQEKEEAGHDLEG